MSATGKPVAAPLVTDLLELWARERPEQIVYTHLNFDGSDPVRLTYAELYRSAAAIATRLIEDSLHGRPVLLLYPAGPGFAPAFFGTLLAGAIATPVPVPRFESQHRRLAAVAMDCAPAALLSSAATLDWLEQKVPATSPLRTCVWLASDWEASSDPEIPDSPIPADIAVLQYTSGSTSEPRGVGVTHANLAHNLATITKEFQPSANARLLSWLPHFHDMGLIGGLLCPLTWGGQSILMTPQQFLRRPLRWLDAIAEFRVEVSGAPNFAYELCVKWAERETAVLSSLDLSSWRIAFVGAEPIRATTLARFTEYFEPCGFRKSSLLPCYGLAEATLLVTCKPAGTQPTIYSVSRDSLEQGRAVPCQEPGRAISLVGCGYPAAGTDVSIVDKFGEPLGCGRVGELWVSGPQVARGYWAGKDSGAFDATLKGCSGRSFLRTGDLGFLTESGEFVFVERWKDLIVIHGQNYACHDLEQSVAESHPLLRPDGCVVGVLDTATGSHLVVAAEFPADALDKIEEAAQAIQGALFTVHGLAARTVAFLPQGKLSRTTSGKLQRRDTLKRLVSGSLGLLASIGEPLPDSHAMNL
jgi:acyl-CoA synthetase (AMP-forming)/AMP-acid ligase II